MFLTNCTYACPVGWSCRIHRLFLCRGVRAPTTSVLNMTLNNLMERFQQSWSFGGMRSTPLLPLLQGPLWPGVVAPDKGPIYGLNRTKPCFFYYTVRAILNKSWRQHPTRHQLYGHLPPITKTIQVRRTRHAGHYWRSRDELIRDVLLWTPTHGRAKARTTSTNIHSAAMWGYGMLSWRPA